MASSGAKKGFGTLLKMGDGASPEVFTTISEITDAKQTGAKFDEIDVTHMESPNGFKEFILGLQDGGTVDVEMNFTNVTAQKSFLDAAGTSKNFQLHLPQLATPVKYSFTGLVQSPNKAFSPKDKLSATCQIKITSSIVESAL